MKEIHLTQGKVAIVDDDDYEEISKHKWHYHHAGYAKRSVKHSKALLMHREILNVPKGFETDHINGDKLDNRKENLRVCTPAENKYNRTFQSNNTSGYKGVAWNKAAKKWFSKINAGGKIYCIGYFTDAKEAALAYNEAALRLHGEFANVNNIPKAGDEHG